MIIDGAYIRDVEIYLSDTGYLCIRHPDGEEVVTIHPSQWDAFLKQLAELLKGGPKDAS